LFAASARKVFVRVYEAGSDEAVGRINHVQFESQGFDGAVVYLSDRPRPCARIAARCASRLPRVLFA
jgi:hypothetical protein